MARSLSKALRTNINDLRDIAALLQSKGRGKDTILAHITEQEAALLKARGGRGSENPDTGLLEFDNDFADYGAMDMGGGAEFAPEMAAPQEITEQPVQTVDATQAAPSSELQSFYAPQADAEMQYAATAEPYAGGLKIPTEPTTGLKPSPETLSTYGLDQQTFQPPTAKAEPTIKDKLADALGIDKSTLEKLGAAAIPALSGLIQQRRGAKQAEAAKAELSQMAAPYRQRAQELLTATQQGALTPVAQQQLQAASAQLQQQAAARGGVGLAQTQTQIEGMRQQLLQQQYDLGLKLSGFADDIQRGAIRTGMEASQALGEAQTRLATELARGLGGMPRD